MNPPFPAGTLGNCKVLIRFLPPPDNSWIIITKGISYKGRKEVKPMKRRLLFLGQGLIEYALILVLIAIVIIIILSAVGVGIGNMFSTIVNTL
jgi:pilus assembly protein Flp/PilA